MRRVIILLTAFIFAAGNAVADDAVTNGGTLLQLASGQFANDQPPLSQAEEQLFRNAGVVDCTPQSPGTKDLDPLHADSWSTNRFIRYDRLAWLCTDPAASKLLAHNSVQIQGAKIVADMDTNLPPADFSINLQMANCFLSMKNCAIQGGIDLTNAHLPGLDLSSSSIHALNAPGLVVDHGVSLRNIILTNGNVILDNANIGGDLDCSGGLSTNFEGSWDLFSAEEIQVGGSVLFRGGFQIQGSVDFKSANIKGNFECTGGQFTNPAPDSDAIYAEQAQIAGNVLLNNVRATGLIDFYGANIGADFECSGAQLDTPGTNSVSLKAPRSKIGGAVFLDEGFVAGKQVDFSSATIGGDFDCTGGQFNRTNDTAISAYCADIKGSVFLDGKFQSHGQVNFYEASVGKNFTCTGAKITNSCTDQGALYAEGIKIDNSVFLDSNMSNMFVAVGQVNFDHASIGADFNCHDGNFNNASNSAALSAESADIKGSVFLDGKFQTMGQVDFYEASVGKNFTCTGAGLTNFSTTEATLYAEGIKINNSVYLDSSNFAAFGQVNFDHASVGGDFNCHDGNFNNGSNSAALSAEYADTRGSVYLDGKFRARGQVDFYETSVGGDLNCEGGYFTNSNDCAIYAEYANIKGNADLRKKFRAEGGVDFLAANIGADFDCSSGSFISPPGNSDAIDAERMKVSGDAFLNANFEANGKVDLQGMNVDKQFEWNGVSNASEAVFDLTSAKVGVLDIDETSLPKTNNLDVNGFTYNEITDGTNATVMETWLNGACRQQTFKPQPYEQLATVLRSDGAEDDAKTVLIQKYDDYTDSLPWSFHTLGDCLKYKCFLRYFNYGYRPIPFILEVSVIFILIGWAFSDFAFKRSFFSRTETDKAKDADGADSRKSYPEFYSFIYSLETFLPLVKLGVADYWRINDTVGEPAKPAEAKPAEAKPAEAKPVEAKPVEAKPATPAEAKPAEGQKLPTAGNLIRFYFWIHIIVGWVFTTWRLGALTGLIKP